MANSAIQSQSIEVDPVVVPGGLRNRIINGQFDIWQRGTTFSGPTGFTGGGAVFLAADRWNSSARGGAPAVPIGNVTVNQIDQVTFLAGQPEVPDNPTFYLQRQVVIVGGGPTDASILGALIEDVRTFNGQRVTLSFWAKGDIPGVLAVNMGQRFGAGGSLGNITPEESFSVSPTWQKYVFFFDVPSIAGKTIGAAPGGGLQVRIYSHAGNAVFTSGLSINYTGNFCITNVQLEEDEVTDPNFEVRPFALELRLAQRYFEVNNRSESNFATLGIPAGTKTNEFWVNFKVTKQVIPVINFNFGLSPPNAGPTFTNISSASITRIELDGFRISYNPVNQDDAGITSRLADDITVGTWSADAD